MYPLVAAVATAVYFLSGHHSWMFNLIGLSSPVLILVALRMWKPDRRLPWVLFAVGQFVFITGDVISYNYATFNGAFPKLFPLDADGLTPFPAYSGAEVCGVRMQLADGVEPFGEYDPGDDDAAQDDSATGHAPEDADSPGSTGHRLYQLRSEDMLRTAGIELRRR